MTHRVFSRNASSSRAIPVKRLIEDVLFDTAMPSHWGKNQPGMQAREEHTAPVMVPWQNADGEFELNAVSATDAWYEARDRAVDMAERFDAAGYHKQVVNRLLEPFSHINVVVTSTSWANFFALRDHPDAQPEIRLLAIAMREAIEASTPRILRHGEWHLPYVLDEERKIHHIDSLKKLSSARCARTSYRTHEGKAPDYDSDVALFDRLVDDEPLHASPTEHQATPDSMVYKPYFGFVWEQPEKHGNFTGFLQHRKFLDGEYVSDEL